jgi:GDPmannose 4,6-dehydratase
MSQNNTKTALIVGGTGQDGAYLARFLVSKGYVVWISTRDTSLNSFVNLSQLEICDQVQFVQLDILEASEVVECIKRIKPCEVYNLAGQSSVGLSFVVPYETYVSIATGTLNLLEAIRTTDQSVRFYNAGSGEVFGDTKGRLAKESTQFLPVSPYGAAKAAAIWQVATYRKSYGLFACTGILFNHESDLRPEAYVTKKIIKAACRIARGSDTKLHLGNLKISRDWGFAPEYVEAMWAMLQLECPEDFVIATGESSSLESFVQKSFAYFDLNWEDYVIIDPELIRPSDIAFSGGCPENARSALKWEAKTKVTDLVHLMIVDELARIELNTDEG